ncbi:MAG: GxxExxY protein [Opitutales bacterium]
MKFTTEHTESTEGVPHPPSSTDTDLSRRVIGCAINVHRELGPGLLESTYERCLAHELSLAGIDHETQVVVPVHYKGLEIETGYRMDLMVEGSLVLELKSVRAVEPIHEAQMLTYLRLSRKRCGLLINFNVNRLIDGVRRFSL